MEDYFRMIAHMKEQIGESRFAALLHSDNTGKVRAFCDELVVGAKAELVVGAKKVVSASFQTIYDQNMGLVKLIKRAVGERNLRNICSDITQDRFPLKGTDVRRVNLRVEPFLNNETSEQAAKRLLSAGHVLGNTGDLAGFLHDHPDEVGTWNWVLAISEDSRWAHPGGTVEVPCAGVPGARRFFHLLGFRRQFDSDRGVLVLSE